MTLKASGALAAKHSPVLLQAHRFSQTETAVSQGWRSQPEVWQHSHWGEERIRTDWGEDWEVRRGLWRKASAEQARETDRYRDLCILLLYKYLWIEKGYWGRERERKGEGERDEKRERVRKGLKGVEESERAADYQSRNPATSSLSSSFTSLFLSTHPIPHNPSFYSSPYLFRAYAMLVAHCSDPLWRRLPLAAVRSEGCKRTPTPIL